LGAVPDQSNPLPCSWNSIPRESQLDYEFHPVAVAQVESPWNAEKPLEPRQIKGICSIISEEWCLRILRPASRGKLAHLAVDLTTAAASISCVPTIYMIVHQDVAYPSRKTKNYRWKRSKSASMTSKAASP